MRNGLGEAPFPAAFWRDVRVVHALRCRDVGALFRLATDRNHGVSQTTLAMSVGLSQGQVSQIVNGTRQVVQIDVLERIADGMAIPDQSRMLLGLAPGHPIRPSNGQARPLLVARGLDAVDLLTAAENAGDGSILNALFDPDRFLAPTRDWLLVRSQASSIQPIEPRAAGVGETRAIVDTFGAFQQLDTKHGGAFARNVIIQYLRSFVSPLLKGTRRDDAYRALCSAAAELVYLAGLTAFDSGSCGAGQYYFIAALSLAQEAEDDAFAANIFAAMAHLAVTHGDGAEAVQLAEAGLLAARREDNMPVTMRLQIALARGHALKADRNRAIQAINAAERALGLVHRPVEHQWERYLDSSYLLGEMSYCFLDLGEPESAEQFASQAVDSNAGRDRRLSLSLSALATAQAEQARRQDHDVDLGVLRDAVDRARQVRSSRSLRAVRDLAVVLRPIDTQPVKDLRQEALQVVGRAVSARCCPPVTLCSTAEPKL